MLIAEKINDENEQRLREVEIGWRNQVMTLRNTLEQVKEQIENEAQLKIQNLIQQHRTELGNKYIHFISS